MNKQVSDPMKQRERKAQPSSQKVRKSLGSQGKELGQDTWGFQDAWDPRDMQQSQAGIKTIQKGMPRNTRNKDRYAPINHPLMQKKDQKDWEPTIHEQEADSQRNPERKTMKEGSWETFNLAGKNRLTWGK